MGLAEKERSSYDGVPVMLYEFSRRSVPTLTGAEVTSYWRYTSADRDFVLGGNTYTAIAISDDGVRQSGDTSADQLIVTMPYGEVVPQMFNGSPPSDPIYCVIRHANKGETDGFIIWAGQIGMVSRGSDSAPEGRLMAQVVCNTAIATMDRIGVRLAWSRACPHDLYGFECRADPKNFYVTAVITALDGVNIVADAIGTVFAAQLTGGFVEWIDGQGHAERLGILQHFASTVRIQGTTDRLTVGQTIYVFFGCDRSRAICNTVFNNMPNHGGHAYMPDTNPFSGDLIF